MPIFVSILIAAGLYSQTPDNVLIVANQSSPVSKTIAEYYARKRQVPASNVCYIQTATTEEIARTVYDSQIAAAVAKCLSSRRLQEQILYIVTTLGVPLRIQGKDDVDIAAVDSELTLLYSALKGRPHRVDGAWPNPYFRQMDAAFTHPAFPMYLVTRLAGYDFADIRGLIDRSLAAQDRGKVYIDLRASGDGTGDEWLRDAAIRLPAGRTVMEESEKVLYNQREAIGLASWGSNDSKRKQRMLGFSWLPGALLTEYVSTNARSFERPPGDWNLSTWKQEDRGKWFHGSPQTMIADYIHEGVTGVTGHVAEPKLGFCPRPDILLPAYFVRKRNLAESFYLSIPALSWQNIVVGDPLCRLK